MAAVTAIDSTKTQRKFGIFKVITTKVTAHTDGTTAALTTDEMVGMYLESMEYWETTAPTADTDVTLTNDQGGDLLGGAGTDLCDDITGSKIVLPLSSNATPVVHRPYIHGNVTLTVANNAVDTAVMFFRFVLAMK